MKCKTANWRLGRCMSVFLALCMAAALFPVLPVTVKAADTVTWLDTSDIIWGNVENGDTILLAPGFYGAIAIPEGYTKLTIAGQTNEHHENTSIRCHEGRASDAWSEPLDLTIENLNITGGWEQTALALRVGDTLRVSGDCTVAAGERDPRYSYCEGIVFESSPADDRYIGTLSVPAGATLHASGSIKEGYTYVPSRHYVYSPISAKNLVIENDGLIYTDQGVISMWYGTDCSLRLRGKGTLIASGGIECRGPLRFEGGTLIASTASTWDEWRALNIGPYGGKTIEIAIPFGQEVYAAVGSDSGGKDARLLDVSELKDINWCNQDAYVELAAVHSYQQNNFNWNRVADGETIRLPKDCSGIVDIPTSLSRLTVMGYSPGSVYSNLMIMARGASPALALTLRRLSFTAPPGDKALELVRMTDLTIGGTCSLAGKKTGINSARALSLHLWSPLDSLDLSAEQENALTVYDALSVENGGTLSVNAQAGAAMLTKYEIDVSNSGTLNVKSTGPAMSGESIDIRNSGALNVTTSSGEAALRSIGAISGTQQPVVGTRIVNDGTLSVEAASTDAAVRASENIEIQNDGAMSVRDTGGSALSSDHGVAITNSTTLSIDGKTYGVYTGWGASFLGTDTATITVSGGNYAARNVDVGAGRLFFDGGIRALENTPTLSNYILSPPTVTASTNRDGTGEEAYDERKFDTYRFIKILPPLIIWNSAIDWSKVWDNTLIQLGENFSDEISIPDKYTKLTIRGFSPDTIYANTFIWSNAAIDLTIEDLKIDSGSTRPECILLAGNSSLTAAGDCSASSNRDGLSFSGESTLTVNEGASLNVQGNYGIRGAVRISGTVAVTGRTQATELIPSYGPDVLVTADFDESGQNAGPYQEEFFNIYKYVKFEPKHLWTGAPDWTEIPDKGGTVLLGEGFSGDIVIPERVTELTVRGASPDYTFLNTSIRTTNMTRSNIRLTIADLNLNMTENKIPMDFLANEVSLTVRGACTISSSSSNAIAFTSLHETGLTVLPRTSLTVSAPGSSANAIISNASDLRLLNDGLLTVKGGYGMFAVGTIFLSGSGTANVSGETGLNKLAVSSGKLTVTGSRTAITNMLDVSGYAPAPTLIASVNQDGSNPEPYNAANFRRYRYISIPFAVHQWENAADWDGVQNGDIIQLGEAFSGKIDLPGTVTELTVRGYSPDTAVHTSIVAEKSDIVHLTIENLNLNEPDWSGATDNIKLGGSQSKLTVKGVCTLNSAYYCNLYFSGTTGADTIVIEKGASLTTYCESPNSPQDNKRCVWNNKPVLDIQNDGTITLEGGDYAVFSNYGRVYLSGSGRMEAEGENYGFKELKVTGGTLVATGSTCTIQGSLNTDGYPYPDITASKLASGAGAGAYNPQDNSKYKYIKIEPGTPFAGGSGTADDPYQIQTAAQLDAVRAYADQPLYFRLENDLDLTEYLSEGQPGWNGGVGWQPIAANKSGALLPFAGTFDGNGHVISGLWCSRSGEDYVGLFRSISGAVRNLGVQTDGDTGVVSENYVGILCTAGESLTVGYCFANAVVFGGQSVGGLVGEVRKTASVENCFAAGQITVLDSFGGGLAGAVSGSLKNSYVSAETHTNNPAGLVGTVAGLTNAGYTAMDCLYDADNTILENPVGSGGSAGMTACSNTEMLTAASTQTLGGAFVSQDQLSAMRYPELAYFAEHKNTAFQAASAAAAEAKKAVLRIIPAETGLTMTVTRIDGRDGVFSATMESSSENLADAQFFAAYYDGNRMLRAIRAEADDPASVSLEFSAPDKGQILRFFLWSDVLTPYIKSITWD